jgi:hypothetical protein
MATDNIWSDFFTGSDMTPDWWNIFFQQAYQDVYSSYLGNIGTSMREGQTPQTFMDYMATNDPWTERYSSLPQVARGTTGMYTNPRTRFLYNF